MPFYKWLEKKSGLVGGVLIFAYLLAQFWLDRTTMWWSTASVIALLVVAFFVSRSRERKKLGIAPKSPKLSDRVALLAAEYRRRAGALENRFGREPEPPSDLLVEEAVEVQRILALRGLVQSDVSLLAGDPALLRDRAQRFEAVASSIRGKPSPHKLKPGELIRSVVVLALVLAAGIGLLVLHFRNRAGYEPVLIEGKFPFYAGWALVAAALLGGTIVTMMQREES